MSGYWNLFCFQFLDVNESKFFLTPSFLFSLFYLNVFIYWACRFKLFVVFNSLLYTMANNRHCYLCGKYGHFAHSCPTPGERACFNCGETGHLSRECTNEAKPKACYICGETTHLSRDCPSPQLRQCYNCGETGHVLRDCPKQRPPRTCFTCGSADHISRECPDRKPKE